MVARRHRKFVVPTASVKQRYIIGTAAADRKRYGGMEASDLSRLKALEEENAKLKRMYAELALDHQMAKEIISKNRDADRL